jgi:hypothetical protein
LVGGACGGGDVGVGAGCSGGKISGGVEDWGVCGAGWVDGGIGVGAGAGVGVGCGDEVGGGDGLGAGAGVFPGGFFPGGLGAFGFGDPLGSGVVLGFGVPFGFGLGCGAGLAVRVGCVTRGFRVAASEAGGCVWCGRAWSGGSRTGRARGPRPSTVAPRERVGFESALPIALPRAPPALFESFCDGAAVFPPDCGAGAGSVFCSAAGCFGVVGRCSASTQTAALAAAVAKKSTTRTTAPLTAEECRSPARRHRRRAPGARSEETVGIPRKRDAMSASPTTAGVLASTFPERADPLTHGLRVALIAAAVGRMLGLEGEQLEQVVAAGFLHDVGKAAVPRAVCEKPGPLNDEEWELMRRHPEASEEFARVLTDEPEILAAIRSHHERWDGSGYPDGLAEGEIPLGARIVAVADAVAAMTESRPYRPAATLESAAEEVGRGRGRQFDPRCLDAFDAIVPSLRGRLLRGSAPLTLRRALDQGRARIERELRASAADIAQLA